MAGNLWTQKEEDDIRQQIKDGVGVTYLSLPHRTKESVMSKYYDLKKRGDLEMAEAEKETPEPKVQTFEHGAIVLACFTEEVVAHLSQLIEEERAKKEAELNKIIETQNALGEMSYFLLKTQNKEGRC